MGSRMPRGDIGGNVLREDGADHVPETDLQINHEWLFSTSRCGCFGAALTPLWRM